MILQQRIFLRRTICGSFARFLARSSRLDIPAVIKCDDVNEALSLFHGPL